MGNWDGDVLNRKADSDFLISFLSRRVAERAKAKRPASFVLNLNAKWGYGKTFFLEHMKRDLESAGYVVATVNAWRDDHADDPIIAVMAAIDDAVKPLITKPGKAKTAWAIVRKKGAAIALAAVKGTLVHWGRKALGDGMDAAIEILGRSEDAAAAKDAAMEEFSKVADAEATDPLEAFRTRQSMIEEFRNGLKVFLSEQITAPNKPPLFVLVDELDRCRPLYAILLLERIKHLFEIDNVVFIVATDTGQLRHTITAVYGGEFDSERYLNRFFDQVYKFEEPTMIEFVMTLMAGSTMNPASLSSPPDMQTTNFIALVFAAFDLSLRDAEQCFDMLSNIVTAWRVRVPIELAVMLPLIIAYHQSKVPALTGAFADRMTEELTAAGRNATITVRQEKITIPHLFKKFVSLADQSLPKIAGGDQGTSSINNWIQRNFSNEMEVLHSNQYRSSSPPFSIILSYPKLIHTAGRLVP